MTRPLAWSHSSLSGFDTCGRQYHEIKVLKNFQDKKNVASMWGDEFHKAAEKYLEKGVVLPANMTPYADYLDKFKDRPGRMLVEQQYALNTKLAPCSFFDKDVWCRGIIDVLMLNGNVAHVDDHKTGKNRKKDMQQLIIFALLTFYHHPEIETVHAAFHWLQHKAIDSETFYRHQMPELWKRLMPVLSQYRRAFAVGVFQPKPSGLCKNHCAVATCEYHGVGRR